MIPHWGFTTAFPIGRLSGPTAVYICTIPGETNSPFSPFPHAQLQKTKTEWSLHHPRGRIHHRIPLTSGIGRYLFHPNEKSEGPVSRARP
jgi:hypothetical protein